jgi:SAM-dependent methyltransferase
MHYDVITQELLLWSKGVKHEVRFWTDWVSSAGGRFAEDYAKRVSGTAAFEPFLEQLFTKGTKLDVLDVGAGPITFLGTMSTRNDISITATDPLADAYQKILSAHGITPKVATDFATAEDLVAFFPVKRFDLVHCRNALDHSFNPVRGIDQMLRVTKPGGFVVLRHRVNEGENEKYSGFHQYNFDEQDGRLVVWNPRFRQDITMSFMNRASVQTRISQDRDWIEVFLRKHEIEENSAPSEQTHDQEESRDRLRDIVRGTFAFIVEHFGTPT